MKNLFSALLVLTFLLAGKACMCREKNDIETLGLKQAQSLQIVCSPELHNISSVWANGFGSLQPELKIELSCQPIDTPLVKGFLYLSSGQSDLYAGPAWKIAIGHSLVVPVTSSKNPFLNEIKKLGLTASQFAAILTGKTNWHELIDGAASVQVQCFIVDNKDVEDKVATFTKTGPGSFNAIKIKSAGELISRIGQNQNSIGFCTLTDVLNAGKNGFLDQINIIPVDKNRNGRIDSFENIYSKPEALTRGAWIGKYPRELCGGIYALSVEKPTNQAALDFMAYVTVNGQDSMKNAGYSILSSAEKTANMLLLTGPVPESQPPAAPTLSTIGLILIISFAILAVFIFLFFRYKPVFSSGIESDDIEITMALKENTIAAPKGLLYDKTHTWLFMEQDGMVKIGVDDFLKHVAGEITQLKMLPSGEKIRKGEKILAIVNNGKQLNIYSPVSGFIRKLNSLFAENPASINTLPYTAGWVYEIEPVNWERETGYMFMFEKYAVWIKDEFSRLKDFLAMSASTNRAVYQQIVLHDGGELKDNVLAGLSPEVWEDFQTHFIDTSK